MATHPQLIPSAPEKPQAPYPGDARYITQSRVMRANALAHGQQLPPEPDNLSLHELAQWWDRTLTGSQVGMPQSPDTPPINTSGLA